jgi:hypothetical protein
MGQVFLGETPGHRKVAVKLIRPEFAADPGFRRRFALEVAAARQVGGFHTALVIDADPDADPAWMVTAYIAGQSLTAVVEEHGPFAPDALRDLGAALAEGLHAIHSCGLVHRDFKPANIIMGEDGPRIIDFGITRRVSATTITPEGVYIGTLQYMSPEHLGSGEITAASDVFSLGSVLVFAATGHGPFDAPEDTAVIGRILAQPPVLGSLDGSLDGPLRDVIGACLAKDPDERPSLEALLAYFSGSESPPAPFHEAVARGVSTSGPQQKLIMTVPPTRDFAASGPVDASDLPRLRVRDLPFDVRLHFWRVRAVVVVVVGAVFTVIVSWPVGVTLAALAGVADVIYRSRSVASYPNRISPAVRRRTRRLLARMRARGYLVLHERPIPNSREVIDHLVIGPTGVYAIDSEKWDPTLPIRSVEGKALYHGPTSQRSRLEHAVWEAHQASGILSEALGAIVAVRPALVIYGSRIPWDIDTVRDVDVLSAASLSRYFRRRARMRDGTPRLTREQVRIIYDAAVRALPDAEPEQA